MRRLSEGLLDRIPARGAIINTASMAGQGWANHLTEINEFIDIADWNKSLEWVDAHADLMADPYLFSKEIAQVWVVRSSHATMAKSVRTASACPGIIDTPLLTDFRATMSDQGRRLDRQPVHRHALHPAPGRRRARWTSAAVPPSLISGANVYADYGFSARHGHRPGRLHRPAVTGLCCRPGSAAAHLPLRGHNAGAHGAALRAELSRESGRPIDEVGRFDSAVDVEHLSGDVSGRV